MTWVIYLCQIACSLAIPCRRLFLDFRSLAAVKQWISETPEPTWPDVLIECHSIGAPAEHFMEWGGTLVVLTTPPTNWSVPPMPAKVR